jgi:orotidine-5'-phosphate decarboxylase
MKRPDPRIFVALDFANPLRALALADRRDPAACGEKVGKELVVTAGPHPVRWLLARGVNVLHDLKFHDIPNTAAQACAAAARLGVFMLNVHASGGRAMLEAARRAVDDASKEAGVRTPLLIAVTVLTSLDRAALLDLAIDAEPASLALRLARLTQRARLDGVVCSAAEARVLRDALGPDFKLVTPGIRPAGSGSDDQARVVTPAQAIANGADYLVVGRPITAAADPLAALADIEASLTIR